MTWSVSVSGSKKEVKEQIVKQVGSSDDHGSAVADLIALVDDQKGEKISLSGSGWNHSASVTISSE